MLYDSLLNECVEKIEIAVKRKTGSYFTAEEHYELDQRLKVIYAQYNSDIIIRAALERLNRINDYEYREVEKIFMKIMLDKS